MDSEFSVFLIFLLVIGIDGDSLESRPSEECRGNLTGFVINDIKIECVEGKCACVSEDCLEDTCYICPCLSDCLPRKQNECPCTPYPEPYKCPAPYDKPACSSSDNSCTGPQSEYVVPPSDGYVTPNRNHTPPPDYIPQLYPTSQPNVPPSNNCQSSRPCQVPQTPKYQVPGYSGQPRPVLPFNRCRNYPNVHCNKGPLPPLPGPQTPTVDGTQIPDDKTLLTDLESANAAFLQALRNFQRYGTHPLANSAAIKTGFFTSFVVTGLAFLRLV